MSIWSLSICTGFYIKDGNNGKTPYNFSQKKRKEPDENMRVQKKKRAIILRNDLMERYMCVLMVASETPSSEAASA